MECCDFGHTGFVAEVALAAWLDEAPTIRTIRPAFGKVVCSRCSSRRCNVWSAGPDGVALVVADRIRICPDCRLPRLPDEVRARPQPQVCAECAEMADGERETATGTAMADAAGGT